MGEHATRLVVVGQGYVGLPLAMAAVDAGMDVVGFDVDTGKVSALTAGYTPIDDVSDGDIVAALATGRYTPTADPDLLAGFDVAVITVPTPLRNGDPDLRFIEAAAHTLAPHLSHGALVVLESTTYPGTTEEVLVPLLETGSGLTAGQDFCVGFSPERIDPGNQQWTFATTPKIVSGVDETALKATQMFYDRIVAETVPVHGTREAEMAKLLENTFRHVNIALVNELSMHAHGLGVDMWEVLRAAATKPFGFMAFHHGPGVGGHCLPVDPSYLSWKIEQDLAASCHFVSHANQINDDMPLYVARRLQEGLNARRLPVNGSHIVVVGVAYKPNSADARETPTTRLVEQLVEWGADVQLADSWVEHSDLYTFAPRVDLTADTLAAADAVIIVTDHDNINWGEVVGHARYVLDTRNRVHGPNVEQL